MECKMIARLQTSPQANGRKALGFRADICWKLDCDVHEEGAGSQIVQSNSLSAF